MYAEKVFFFLTFVGGGKIFCDEGFIHYVRFKMSLRKILQKLKKNIKKNPLFNSEDSDSDGKDSQTGVGVPDAPSTRPAPRKRLFRANDSDSDNQTVPKTKKKKKLPRNIPSSQSGSDTDESASPLPGPSTVLNPKKELKKQQNRAKKVKKNAPPASHSLSEDADSADSTASSPPTSGGLYRASRDKLFEQKTPIYENNQIEIYVCKEAFKKQKVFNIEDHLYTIKIRLKSGEPPLLSSILKALEKSLEFMVKQMQLHYKNGNFWTFCSISFPFYFFLSFFFFFFLQGEFLFAKSKKIALKGFAFLKSDFSFFFIPEPETLLYMTIYQNAMTSAIQSGAFQLGKNQANNMVHYSMNMLNNFLNSAENLRLDDSFIIYFKTVSAEHVNYKKHRRGPVVLLGAGSDESLPGQLNIRQSLDSFFKDKCILSHIVLGLMRFETNSTNKFFLLLNICGPHPKTRVRSENGKLVKQTKPTEKNVSRATAELSNQLLRLISKCGFLHDGPYDVHEVLPKIAESLNIQIHLIHSIQSKQAAIDSYPDHFDSARPQIVLYRTSQEHASYVYDLKVAFRYFKKQVCFKCKETFWFNYQHVCKKSDTCFSCRKTYQQPSDCPQVDQFFETCDSQIETSMLEFPLQCEKCNIPITTQKCFLGHKKICGISESSKGKAGFYCEKCNTFFGRNRSGFANSKEAKEMHICDHNIKKCYLCRNIREENHQCPIGQAGMSKVWPNLAFVAFANKTNQSCVSCFSIKEEFRRAKNMTWREVYSHENFSKLFCEKHAHNWELKSEPNLAVIYKEIERGVFERKVISEEGLNLESEETHVLSQPYVDKDLRDVPKFKTEARYNKPSNSLVLIRKGYKEKEKKTLIEKLLLELTSPSFQNYVVLGLHASQTYHSLILNGLVDLHFRPYVIQNGNRINLISVDSINLRFLNCSSYLSGSLEEIRDAFAGNEEIIYFPET